EGIQEGTQEGSYNTLYSVIQTMKKNGITNDNIAKMTNLDIYIVKKILNREEIEIPLNFLKGESGANTNGSSLHS
ncbi:MAG: hypothetical protein JJV89_03910, partial [Desulfosarcina sp.]|nr:hypothetical protein [Desulfobacterales bacterium]